jgi:hypothetical protein
MSKKKAKKQSAPSKAVPAETVTDAGPFLSTAHPPAKNFTLLIISAILLAVWILFLLAAAISS